MSLNRLLLVIICIGFALPISAQCNQKKADKLVVKAREAARSGQVQKQISLLKKSVATCPAHLKANMMLGDIYRQKRAYGELSTLLESYLYQANKIEVKAATYFILGMAQWEIGSFHKAIVNFRNYMSKSEKEEKKRRAYEMIGHCEFAITALKNPHQIEKIPLPNSINSSNSEYLPVLSAEEDFIIFTRRVDRREFIYGAQSNEKQEWSDAQRIQAFSDPYQKGALSISPDGKLIVFAMSGHPNGRGGFDLYFMQKKAEGWTKPKNMGSAVNTPVWESQPSIGPDNKSIYFASDRKGGHGGADIWKTRMDDHGNWMKPLNLGLSINTRHDEESPFIHRDGVSLYFRSKGHRGLGDFDIFLSRRIDNRKWTEATNLGYPINSRGNDGSLFVKMDGEHALIATESTLNEDSAQNFSVNNLDIFEIQLPVSYRAIPTSYVKVKVRSAASGREIIAKLTLQSFENRDTLFFDPAYGGYEQLICLPLKARYAMSVMADGHIPYFAGFDLNRTTLPEKPFIIDVILDEIPVSSSDSIPGPVVLENVLFEHNSADLKPGSYTELNKLKDFLNQNPNLKIEIRGHTDNSGSSEYNLQLSNARANSVLEYLVIEGIERSRMKATGFGETSPIDNNETESGRANNRRTEFMIIH
jgi:flagellar motor protein MotB